MPEGPEVQTVLNVLEQEIRGAEIREVEVRHPKLAANLPVAEFEQALRGQRIEGFSRIGKYLVLITTDYDWIIHLRCRQNRIRPQSTCTRCSSWRTGDAWCITM